MGKIDPRDAPSLAIVEAAHYLRLPQATLRSWVMGRPYPTTAGQRKAPAVFQIAGGDPPALSFNNLVEAHVLESITRTHQVPLQKVRRALRYLVDRMRTDRPLIDSDFQTDGKDLFVEVFEGLINVTQDGQLALAQMLELHLSRIDRDERGLARRLFPFTGAVTADSPRLVVIDPTVCFGRPVIVGTRIPIAMVTQRWKAGETIAVLAEDYGRPQQEIEEAIRCETFLPAAA
jgi:uncharacterized protein (DUF433 family)